MVTCCKVNEACFKNKYKVSNVPFRYHIFLVLFSKSNSSVSQIRDVLFDQAILDP